MSDTPETANTEASVESSAPSASETANQQGNASGQVESSEKQQAQPQADGSTKQGKREFFARRQAQKSEQKARSLEEQIQGLQETVSQLAERLEGNGESQEPSSAPETVVNPSSPDIAKLVSEQVSSQISQVMDESRYNSEAGEAENWLLTRSHIKNDPSAMQEIEAMLQGELAHVASKHPKAAADAAYLRWCSSKGVAPDLESVNSNASISAQRAGGVAPSGSISGPSRRTISQETLLKGNCTLAEANQYLRSLKPGSPEWFAGGGLIEDGVREGRIKK